MKSNKYKSDHQFHLAVIISRRGIDSFEWLVREIGWMQICICTCKVGAGLLGLPIHQNLNPPSNVISQEREIMIMVNS